MEHVFIYDLFLLFKENPKSPSSCKLHHPGFGTGMLGGQPRPTIFHLTEVFFGGPEKGRRLDQLTKPTSLAFHDGDLYIADGGNFDVC